MLKLIRVSWYQNWDWKGLCRAHITGWSVIVIDSTGQVFHVDLLWNLHPLLRRRNLHLAYLQDKCCKPAYSLLTLEINEHTDRSADLQTTSVRTHSKQQDHLSTAAKVVTDNINNGHGRSRSSNPAQRSSHDQQSNHICWMESALEKAQPFLSHQTSR